MTERSFVPTKVRMKNKHNNDSIKRYIFQYPKKVKFNGAPEQDDHQDLGGQSKSSCRFIVFMKHSAFLLFLFWISRKNNKFAACFYRLI